MFKFTLGLFLGLTVGAWFFHHQVRKVDDYSFKIGYMDGRVNQSQQDGTDEIMVPVACGIYRMGHYGNNAPLGYTIDRADKELKALCPEIQLNSSEQ